MSNIDPIAIGSSFDIQRSIFDIKSVKLVPLSRRGAGGVSAVFTRILLGAPFRFSGCIRVYRETWQQLAGIHHLSWLSAPGS
jgi:hypothetical protein